MPPRRIPNPRNASSSGQDPDGTLFVELPTEGLTENQEEELPPPPPSPPGGDVGLRDILQTMAT